MQNKEIKKIVILGGGSAGWLTAGIIAADHKTAVSGGLEIVLVESTEVNPIGVGEGTWPSMRATLKKIGISETELIQKCEASFKQGTKFQGWVNGAENDVYYHPFVLPAGYGDVDLVLPWQKNRHETSFADAVSCQSALSERGLAPKQMATPEYASVANYGYHLNSVKLGELLQEHCKKKLGVRQVLDHVVDIVSDTSGDIRALTTKAHGEITGDLFVDCSGVSSLLLGKHFEVPFISRRHVLFNDSAIAVQVPYQNAEVAIASNTISTAHESGWIWDIGLPTRRGVGCVFSSAHCSTEAALETLKNYIALTQSRGQIEELQYRNISIDPGHREKFWYKNCVAIGMSSGFLEPLEASALVLVEASAKMLSELMPENRKAMEHVAQRFNKHFLYYWDSIVDFLKLHYVLSQRDDSDYWRDNKSRDSIPDRLAEFLAFWKYHVPSRHDFPMAEEMFPAASWQYILYGMGFETAPSSTLSSFNDNALHEFYFRSNTQYINKIVPALPSNRELIKHICEFGLPKS